MDEDEMPPELAETDAKPKSRSGARWTEQDWAEHGYRTVKVRVPIPVAEAFQALAQRLGATRSATLEALLDLAQDDPPAPKEK